ncbi:hypothetical protein MBGDF03_01080 [Thermoplasmatales archaeon SCGC AB-540-F20]|nr:hypothetical protein MBGDF03_01080 [Thermoplasmatales archaeon SCGC AB-540-F20]
MERNNLIKKVLAVAVILLFISVSVIQSTSTIFVMKPTMPTFNDNTIYVDGSVHPNNYTKIQDAINDINNDIEWSVTLNFNETDGKTDYVVFGEGPDANDGPPVDSYDEPKPPPPPMPPYVHTWFDDNLAEPYNLLFKDYRKYPDAYKVWNLSIQWAPSDYVTSTY